MAPYNLEIKKSLPRDLDSVPRKDAVRIMEAVRSLAGAPRPPQSQKLSGREQYRLRQGDYRILYSIDDATRTVCVVKVAHRKEVYR